MNKIGTAGQVAQWLLVADGLSPWLALGLVYFVTILFAVIIIDNAAAVLKFPIALPISEQLDVSIMPFAIVVMFAASASFITLLGCQTNLMILGPGGYRLSEYLRLGIT